MLARIFALLAVHDLPTPPCLAPVTTLVSSHPYGGQLSLDVSLDGTRGFVADGAVIRILDLTAPNPPQFLATVPVPNCQPLAQLHYKHPADQKEYLFIAGGSHGLWRLPLSTGSYEPELIFEMIGGPGAGSFQRKRCVDIAVLDAPHGGAPVLFALFAASSNTADSDINASELRAFRLLGTSVAALATFAFPTTLPGQTASVGTSLATDPSDLDSVWVGMGKGGIWQIDLTASSTLQETQLPNAWAGVDYVSDIAIVHAPTLSTPKSFLYAGLNFVATANGTGRIAEYDLGTSSPTHMVFVGTSRPMRISAVTDGGTGVRVAVAEHYFTVLEAETVAPHTVNGTWTGICFGSGTGPDPDELDEAADLKKIELFQRDLAADPAQAPLALVSTTGLPVLQHGTWGSLILRRISTTAYRLFACTSEVGTKVWDVAWAGTASAALQFHYKGVASVGAQKGTVSLVNPEIVRFGLEGGSADGIAAMVVHIDATFPYTITPISGTSSTCSVSFPPCEEAPNCKPQDTSFFQAAILGEAHWLHSSVNDQEFFFPTAKMLKRVTYTGSVGQSCGTCTTVPDCAPNWDNPCGFGHLWMQADLDGVTINPLVLGWRLVRMAIPTLGSAPPIAPAFNVFWRQVQAPRSIPEQQSSEGSDLGYSIVDPRLKDNGWPERVYGLRQGSSTGLKVLDPEELSNWTPPAGSLCDSTPTVWGFGERITGFSSAQALTHIELQPDGDGSASGCLVAIDCGDGILSVNPRRLLNNGAEIFKMRSPTGEGKYVLAAAVGFPGGEQDPLLLPTICRFQDHRYKPMLDLFDVTQTTAGGNIAEPRLLRVAIGNVQGTAFDVAVKSYGSGSTAQHYAFVADVTGSLRVFDVSYDELFGTPATVPYPMTLILDQVAWLTFPKDPHDGYPANVVDVEVEGGYLYCALSRAGIGIVDIGDPLDPKLCAVLETPGLALGISFRTLPGTNQRQLIVGDSRCGIRIYE